MRFKIKNGVLLECKQPSVSRTVIVPEKVTAIGVRAFEKWGLLKRIYLPEHITSIGPEAFSGCFALTTLAPLSMKNMKGAFLPEGLQSIGERAFEWCANLTAMTVPSSVEHIGSFAFSRCGLGYLSIPESVSYIGKMLLYETGCAKVTFFMHRIENDMILQIRRENGQSFSFSLPYNAKGTSDRILDLLLRKYLFVSIPSDQKNSLLCQMVESGYLTDEHILSEQHFFDLMIDEENTGVLDALMKSGRVFPELPAEAFERLIQYANDQQKFEIQLQFMEAMRKYCRSAEDFAERFQL